MTTKKTNKESTGAAPEQAGARTTPRWKAGKSNNVTPEHEKMLEFSQIHSQNVKSDEKPLNAKQQRFVDEYLIDLNATQAAIRAGYSVKTAKDIACENLAKPNIAAAIQAAREKTAAKLEVTRERVLAEYAKMAFLDPRQFYNDDGSIKSVPDMGADAAAALVGFEVDEIRIDPDGPVIGHTKKIKWSDKRAALDSINRMMGWNQDKIDLNHGGQKGNPVQTVVTRVVMVPKKEKAEVLTRPAESQGDE